MVRADLPDEQRRQRLRDGGEADAPARRGFEPAEQSADGSFSRGGARPRLLPVALSVVQSERSFDLLTTLLVSCCCCDL
jgi:hypothetical protein